MKQVDFDRFTQNYNHLLHQQTRPFSEDERYFAAYKVDIARKLASRFLREVPRKILEFGCGIGRNIPFLSQSFPTSIIIGSDVSALSLDVARMENPRKEFFQEGACPQLQSEFDFYCRCFPSHPSSRARFGCRTDISAPRSGRLSVCI